MSKQPKRWHQAPDPPIHYINALSDLGFIMARVLYNRGLTTPEAARHFLSGNLPIHDPFKMKGMSKAVARVRNAIRHKDPIIIYGDFDADGVTSTALLVQTIRALGGIVTPYIPDRIDEGYGLNTPALEQLASDGTKLLITVDCGIRSVEEVRAGQAAGLDIIITDHHSVGEVIPPALAVLNPKQAECDYPEDMLAGVGIAYKLASALLTVAHAQDTPPPSITENDLLDLVAIGTVADLAPLDRFENRKLVQLGLEELSKAKRVGVFALMDRTNIQPEKINATNIGYGIGPRINAAGRLEKAITAYSLLMTNDWSEANDLANALQEINRRRQELTMDSYQRARAIAVSNGDIPTLIFAADESFLPGIVGLVAGRLTEEFYRPSVVIEIGQEESHGSCRSMPEFNITHALDQCADLLLRHGGHAQAAGFAIQNKNLPHLHERLKEITETELAHYDLQPSLNVDAGVDLIELTMDLARTISRLEPMGTENPEPIFTTERLRVIEARQVGREGNHLKLRLADGPNAMDAIAFGFGDWYSRLPHYIDVAYHLQINEWKNRLNLQMNIVDIHPSKR